LEEIRAMQTDLMALADGDKLPGVTPDPPTRTRRETESNIAG